MDDRTLPLERWLTPRSSRIAIVVVVLLSLAALFSLRNVRVDYDFEQFFPKNDPELDSYLSFRERFGYDNDFLLFGLQRSEGVFDGQFLQRADSLTARLCRLPRVIRVLSPTRLSEPIVTPVGVFDVPSLRFQNDSTLALDSAAVWHDERIRENFFAKNGRSMLLVLTAEPNLSKLKCDTLLANVRAVMASTGFSDAKLAGRIVGQDHYITTMVKETLFFLTTSIALLAVFLWIGFRSVYSVIVPIAVVGLAILWQVGFMTALGKPLGILTMLLPTILFVVGMSDVVHLLECYLDEIRRDVPRVRAIAATYHEAGLPTFLTAVTSGIGFATLGTASIPPLQEFGFFTAIGVLVAFSLAFLLLPALLVLIPAERFLPRVQHVSPWDSRLPALFRFTIKHRKAILMTFGAISLVGTLGASRIRTNNFLLEDLPAHDPMKQGFLWFEKEFGGVRPFEMEITVAEGRSIWDLDVLQRIEHVQAYLDTTYAVDAIVSPVTLMRSLNKAFNGGDAAFYKLPDDAAECARYAKRTKLLGKEVLSTLVSADGRHARLTGRMVDEGGFVHKQKNTALEAVLKANDLHGDLRFQQTGMAYLIDRNNETLSQQLVFGMGMAIVLTALIMIWFFRDIRMVLVALIPNLVPLLFIAGVMGFVGIDLKVSTAIIFTIAFGIAEDDTIHMLAALRHHLRNGHSPAFALRRTYIGTGKAVTVTNLMLLSGFVLLVFSDFASIYYMGVLITLTLAFAYVAELFLLPALVMALMRPTKKAA